MASRKKATKATGKKRAVVDNSQMEVVNSVADALMGLFPEFSGTQVSQANTLLKNLRNYLVSNMRQLLSQAYVEHGLVQTVVNVPVEDAFRGGLEIKSKQLSGEEIEALSEDIETEGLCNSVFAQAMKWNRLFGGAGVIIMTDQDPSTPLDMDAINENSKLEFRAVDMWELFHDKQEVEGIDLEGRFGEPEYYNYYGVKLHASRVMKIKGIEAPSFVRPRLRGWGISAIEALIRSINNYVKSNDLTFEVIDEFKLDIFKIKGLAQALLSPNGPKRIQERVALANRQKNYQNAMVMDAEDDHLQKQLAFDGVASMMGEFRIQIASDMRMPLTKLFGLSAQGFSSGEDDIENYNATVESDVREKAKPVVLKTLRIKCKKKFGYVPSDLTFSFRPLRILSSEQQESVKNAKMGRVIQAFQAGLCSLFEAKESINKDDLLPVKVDLSKEDISVFAKSPAEDVPEDTGDIPSPKAPKPPKAPKSPEPPK